MTFNFGKFNEQAQAMLERMKSAQESLNNLRITGESGAGLVKITLDGRHYPVKVQLDDALMKEKKSVVEDLITAAFTDAVARVEKSSKEKLSQLTNGMIDPSQLKDFLADTKNNDNKE